MASVEKYGTLPDGRVAKLFTLKNRNGMEAKVTDYGAILVSLLVPDCVGRISDVTLGYDSLDGWLANTSYFGATIGRYGNRIAAGKFHLDGVEHLLAINNEPGGLPCHLHGGLNGFDQKLWQAEAHEDRVILTYCSPDGEEGYPGTLTVCVTYILDDQNQLIWQATATTDKATPVNIIHHSYWNLSNKAGSSIANHELLLEADFYLPTNAGLIPTGELARVEGTPLDFLEPRLIGERIDGVYEALHVGSGYDHAWVLRGEGLRRAAMVHEPTSGRRLELYTEQPGIHFYSGNFIDGTVAGKGGLHYEKRSGFCLETERFPDGPNQVNFPNCILRPGETYGHTLIHKFSW